jgi:electron transport complex protein RnfC
MATKKTEAATPESVSATDATSTTSATATVEAPTAEAAKKAAIAAAMQRARAQRESVQPKNTEEQTLTVAQKKEIAEIEARRAPLQAEQAEKIAAAPDRATQEQASQ